MSEVKKTAQSAMIYGIGIAIHKLAGFIMLPIYTRYLSPADYGTIELLTMTIDVVSFLVGVGLAESIFRFYFKYEEQEQRKKILSTAFLLSILFYAVAGLLGFLAATPLGSLILEGRAQDTSAFQLIFIIFLLDPFQTIPMILLRAQQRPRLFVSVAVIRLFFQLAFNIYFVVYLKMGIFGILTSTLIITIGSGLIMSVYLLKFTGLNFSKSMAHQLLVYGAPLIISNLGNFIITFSDRYFLKIYWNLGVVGLYSLGYKLGFLLSSLAVAPIFATWDPKRFEISGDENFQQTNQTVFFYFSYFLLTAGLAIALGSRDLFRIMSAPEFVEAYKIVPFIMLAYIFQAWTNFTNFGIYHSGRTKYMAVIGAISAVIIILLSFLLIPTFGAVGAALATAITFLLRLLLTHHYSQKFFYLDLPWGKALSILGSASAIYLISRLLEQKSIKLSIAVNTFLFGLYLGALFISPLFSPDDRMYIIRIVRNSLKSIKEFRHS